MKFACLREVIKTYGPRNVRFVIPMRPLRGAPGLFTYTSSNDPWKPTLCELNLSRCDPLEGNKITLAAHHPAQPMGSESFYVDDLSHLLRSRPHEYSAFVETIDGYSRVEFVERGYEDAIA